MEKFSVTVLFALLAIVGWAQADSSIEAPPSLVVGQTTTVQGLVRFEEHHTIIPLLCFPQAVEPCVRSRPYWSVIIYTDSSQFEIDQRFALDQLAAPDSVQLAGQTIRPGQVVKVQATVEYASSGYYILGNVRDVDSVFDYSTLSLPNWSCHGTVDRDTEIQAQVWYTGAAGGSEGDHYTLQLAGAEALQDGHRTFSLASLSDAQGFTSRNQLVYQGQDVGANVELVIDSPAPLDPSGELADPVVPVGSAVSAVSAVSHDQNVPGHLKFTLSQAPQQSQIQAQGDFPVVCGRTR